MDAGREQEWPQRPGRDGSGAAISCLSPSARGLRIWAWDVGLGLQGCLDLRDGARQEEREAEPGSGKAHLHLVAVCGVEGQVESWKGLHQPLGRRVWAVTVPHRFCLQAVTFQFRRGPASQPAPAWACHLGLEH